MTILASIMTLPVALLVEGKQVVPTLKALIAAGNGKTLLVQMLLSAVFYYLYNEVAFLALDNVAPVTHALGWKYLNICISTELSCYIIQDILN